MEEQVTIQKNTLVLLALSIVAGVGLFVLFGNSAAQNPEQIAETPQVVNGMQEISIRALPNGLYDAQEVVVKKGIPVRLTFTADPNSGCGQILMMRQFGVQLLSRNGEAQVATFTPTEEGVYEYSCSMRMFVGTMRVVA